MEENLQQPQATPTPQAQPQPPQQQPQVDINDLVSNISNRINDTLNQRLSPIEQRMNQQTPEQLEAQNEQIRQQFENNPMEFVKSIQDQAKEQALSEFKNQYDPMIKETQQLGNKMKWQDQVRQFNSQNPEAQKYIPQITEVLRGNPGLMSTSNPLDSAYKMAVANNLLGNGGNVVQGILGNEEYRQQIMQNPELKQAIIQEYQQGLNSGQQGIPPLMGSQGGNIPAGGGETPNNLKEAKAAAIRRFQQNQ
jgi:hypothetical protein